MGTTSVPLGRCGRCRFTLEQGSFPCFGTSSGIAPLGFILNPFPCHSSASGQGAGEMWVSSVTLSWLRVRLPGETCTECVWTQTTRDATGQGVQLLTNPLCGSVGERSYARNACRPCQGCRTQSRSVSPPVGGLRFASQSSASPTGRGQPHTPALHQDLSGETGSNREIRFCFGADIVRGHTRGKFDELHSVGIFFLNGEYAEVRDHHVDDAGPCQG